MKTTTEFEKEMEFEKTFVNAQGELITENCFALVTGSVEFWSANGFEASDWDYEYEVDGDALTPEAESRLEDWIREREF